MNGNNNNNQLDFLFDRQRNNPFRDVQQNDNQNQ